MISPRGPPGTTVHRNLVVADAPARVRASTTTMPVPIPVGTPAITPVVPAIDSPRGSPLAPYCTDASPTPTALTCSRTAAPTEVRCSPGLVNAIVAPGGVRAGAGD